MRFDGETVVVTGGGSGIGAATVKRLHALGANLVVVDRDPRAAHQICDELGDRSLACVADVSVEKDVDSYMAQAVDKFGKINCVFNNAGTSGPLLSIDEYDLDAFDEVLRINVRGMFLGLRAAFRYFKSSGIHGRIVNTGSIRSFRSIASMAGYVASKHAVAGLTKVAAMEGAAFGVRVNAVCPGLVDTPLLRNLQAGGFGTQDESPLEAATPEQVANAVTWLLSEEAAYVNGTLLTVDAGRSL